MSKNIGGTVAGRLGFKADMAAMAALLGCVRPPPPALGMPLADKHSSRTPADAGTRFRRPRRTGGTGPATPPAARFA